MDEHATKRIPILEMAGSSISSVARILFREVELNSDSHQVLFAAKRQWKTLC